MLDYTNLDPTTRAHMRTEVEEDLANGDLVYSRRFTRQGMNDYPALLLEAVDHHDDQWLTEQLNSGGRIKTHETSHSRTGAEIQKAVPHTAAATMAEGEFNRFYARGLCRGVVESGGGHVEVYRARAAAKPRVESEQLIGELVDAATLLDDLRTNLGVEPALGVPAGPNSGLSVRLPQRR